jgi:GH18 family chitinase
VRAAFVFGVLVLFAPSLACSDSASSSRGGGDASADDGEARDGARGAADDAGGIATTQWVMGYYVGYAIDDYPISQIDWSALTHIIFSPMVVKSDQSLDLSFSDANGTGPADAKALSKAAHGHGVKALLM